MNLDSEYDNRKSEEAFDKLYPPQSRPIPSYDRKSRKPYCLAASCFVLLFPCILTCLMCHHEFEIFFLPDTSKTAVTALVPPQYPNSVLVDERIGGGGRQWRTESKNYETSDSLQQVMAFMQNEGLPPFEYDSQTGRYWSRLYPDKKITTIRGSFSVPGSVTVEVWQKSENPSTTVIRITMAYYLGTW
ncbi:MAG: hypothetical protein HND46_13875 [Chloroflexi bacterium]|nr:hypothetical protein [Chloroflexota bacterium]NOG64500.1 hypothetical protein [Chloroflexota bacterium]